MSEEMSIAEYYIVSYRPYDADGGGTSLLEKAMRAFFADGATCGTVRSVENGKEIRTRYKLAPKRFRWKKTCGGVTLQEAFAVQGGQFRLVAHDFSGRLLSALTYDAGLRWLRTAYYDGNPAEPAAVLRRGEDGLFLLLRGEEEVFLLPCPWEPGTAAQSFVNAREGDPLVVAHTDAGDFCFCSAEERARRIALREEAVSRTSPAIGEEGGEALEFHVIRNNGEDECIPASGFAAARAAGKDLPAAEAAASPAENESIPVPAAPAGGASVPVSPAPQTAVYAADHEITLTPEEDSAPKSAELKIEIHAASAGEAGRGGPAPASSQHHPSGKYAVAAKGLAGGVRTIGGASPQPRSGAQQHHSSAAPAKAPEAPAGSAISRPAKPMQAQPEALIPAKRIVVSSMESYLYFGKLLEGLRQGRGRTATPDGRTAYEGNYRDDMRDGFGVYYYKSGALCYAGEWKRNLRDGLGVAFGAKDGSIFVGNWKNGTATGSGSEFDMRGRLTYTGEWKNGRRHGYGTEYRGGRVWRSGVWRDDVFCAELSPSGPQHQ
jgi:hypothetical protein